MALEFRNLSISPSDPVELWGFEGLLAAVDRGDVRDWARIARAVSDDPFGEVASDLEAALDQAEFRSNAAVLRVVLERARRSSRAKAQERIRDAFKASRMTQKDFAASIGTSRSRLSTYLAGTVMPSAEALVNMEQVGRRRRGELGLGATPSGGNRGSFAPRTNSRPASGLG